MAGAFDRFLLVTVLLDVFILGLGQPLRLPVPYEVYAVVVLFVVSPVLAYLVVYRLLDRWGDEE